MCHKNLVQLLAIGLCLAAFGCDADHETGPALRPCVQPIVPISELEEEPVLLFLFVEYPEEARSQQLEGNVLVLALVDYDGSVCSARIGQSSGYPVLDAAAKRSAEASKFSSLRSKNRGIPVRAEVMLPLRFSSH